MPLPLYSYPLVLFVAICSQLTRKLRADRRPAAEQHRGRAPLRPLAMALRQPRDGGPRRPRPPVMALRQPRIGATVALATSPAGHGAPATPHRGDVGAERPGTLGRASRHQGGRRRCLAAAAGAPGDVDAEWAGAQGRAERHQGWRSGRLRCLAAAPGGAWQQVSTAPVCGSRRVSSRRGSRHPPLVLLPHL